MNCAPRNATRVQMDWASAEAHRDRLAEWGLDGNPERRQNPFEAHRPPGTLTAATDATEPDPLARMPAALLDMVQRGDGAMTPGVGIPAAQLPPRPASPPPRTPAHWGPQLHDPEWLAIRETWKKILDGDPHYKARSTHRPAWYHDARVSPMEQKQAKTFEIFGLFAERQRPAGHV